MSDVDAALAAALELARSGFPVFPCNREKRPTCPGGFKAATRDPHGIEVLWNLHPGVRVGIPTGEATQIAVLDLDTVKHPEAVPWLQEHGPKLGNTMTVETESGGQHWYYQHRAGLRCSTGEIWPGVDVRADGGYVIAWAGHGLPVLLDAPMAPWPAHLDDLLGARPGATTPSAPPSPGTLKAHDRNLLAAIVRALPNDSRFDNRSTWLALAHALAAAFADDPDLAEELWLEHSGKREQKPGEPERVWNTLLGPHLADASWLIDMAKKAGIDTRQYEITGMGMGAVPDAAGPLSLSLAALPAPMAEAVARLAALDPVAYDLCRKAEAKSLKLRTRVLDEAVKAARRDAVKATRGSSMPADAQSVDSVKQIIDEFNLRYMVVNEAGKTVVYEPTHDPRLNRRRYLRITFEDFQRRYLNRLIQCGEKLKTAGDVWLSHPDRRQYLGGVVFDPSGRHVRDDTLNLWQGFAVQPRPGSWGRLREHVLSVICNGSEEHFQYLLGWMARLVQYPAEQGEVSVVLRGGEGTGKGTLARSLLHILGQHGFAVSNSRLLTGSFNSHLRDTVLLFADEAFFAGDKSQIGALKSIITEPYLAIEAKYENAVQLPNFLHVMMASNEQWVVPASLDARRFFVLEVPDIRVSDHAYFSAIWAEMNAGGYEGLLYDLLDFDLAAFNVRNVPVTDGLREQRKLSMGTGDRWWFDCLHRGTAIYSYPDEWREEVSTEALYGSYLDFAKRAGERHPMHREAFGKFMRRMGAKPKRLTARKDHETPAGDNGGQQPRPQGYTLGALSLARADFCKKTGLPVDWPPEGDEEPDKPQPVQLAQGVAGQRVRGGQSGQGE